MADVLKIVTSSTEYTFSHLVIPVIRIDTMQDEENQELGNGKPIIYTVSNEYKILTVTFNSKEDVTVYDNLLAIVDCEEILDLTMYYRNGTESNNLQVKVDPRLKLNYKNGSRTDDFIKAIFYQAAELTSALEYLIYPRAGGVV